MTDDSRLTLRWAVAASIAVLLVATGGAASYLLTRTSLRPAPAPNQTSDGPASPTSHSAGHNAPPSAAATTDAPGATLSDVTVTLTTEAVERAGITVAAVRTGSGATAMRIPGVVEANAYKQVVVTPIVSGRITRVLVELGQHVNRGQTMAQIFSPELADAQARFVSARAELEAHERELQRTETLVEIGAASRQELERIHAGHTARTAEVQSARSRLLLLGVSTVAADRLVPGNPIDAATSVPAPLSGVVTERLANVGLNVDPATKLFTVVDLSSVWIMADVYERDASRVRIGSAAAVTTAAYPALAVPGRISYIDPQVNPDTRTIRVRVEVPNPRTELRLGMLADVSIAEPAQASVLLIPRAAVQNVDDRRVVYLVNQREPRQFVEREVRLGEAVGDQLPVLAGLNLGDIIVGEGSFYVRAERERLGLRTRPSGAPPGARADPPGTARESNVQTARVTVGDQAFEPSRLTLRAGVPARVTFVRTSDKTCAKEVAFPSLNITRALPLNQPVVIEFTPAKGELAFACGMNMLRGTIVAE